MESYHSGTLLISLLDCDYQQMWGCHPDAGFFCVFYLNAGLIRFMNFWAHPDGISNYSLHAFKAKETVKQQPCVWNTLLHRECAEMCSAWTGHTRLRVWVQTADSFLALSYFQWPLFASIDFYFKLLNLCYFLHADANDFVMGSNL